MSTCDFTRTIITLDKERGPRPHVYFHPTWNSSTTLFPLFPSKHPSQSTAPPSSPGPIRPLIHAIKPNYIPLEARASPPFSNRNPLRRLYPRAPEPVASLTTTQIGGDSPRHPRRGAADIRNNPLMDPRRFTRLCAPTPSTYAYVRPETPYTLSLSLSLTLTGKGRGVTATYRANESKGETGGTRRKRGKTRSCFTRKKA